MKGTCRMIIIESENATRKPALENDRLILFLRFYCVVCLMILCAPAGVSAHGTEGSIKEINGWMIEASYDDGEAMSYTETKVFHEPDTMPFQTGRTDKNGRFLFYPDGPGTWRVEVQDEMGHAVILKTEVKSDGGNSQNEVAPGATTPSKGRDKVGGLMAGVGIITFVFGLFFWLSGRKFRLRDQP